MGLEQTGCNPPHPVWQTRGLHDSIYLNEKGHIWSRYQTQKTEMHIAPNPSAQKQGGLLRNRPTFHTGIMSGDEKKKEKNQPPYFPSSSNSWYSSVNLVQIVNAILQEVPSKRCAGTRMRCTHKQYPPRTHVFNAARFCPGPASQMEGFMHS